MAGTRYQSSLGSQPSGSMSVYSTDDPPPPPPPRTKDKSRSKLGRSFESHDSSYVSEEVPQSRYEEDNESYDYSHGSRKSSRSRKGTNVREKAGISSTESYDSRVSHDSFSVPPPPPPPSAPPSSTGNRRNKSSGLDRISEHVDDESVDTEVLQYGHDGTSASNSKDSVAARRRKKAQEKSRGTISSPRKTAQIKIVSPKSSPEKEYDDPPLELYSDSDSDISANDREAINKTKKKKKKKGGFSRVKSLILRGVSFHQP